VKMRVTILMKSIGTQIQNEDAILSSSSFLHAIWSSPHAFQPGHTWSVFENPKSMIFGYNPHFCTMFLGTKSLCSTPQRWIKYNSQNKTTLPHNQHKSRRNAMRHTSVRDTVTESLRETNHRRSSPALVRRAIHTPRKVGELPTQ
jgi:hypothetical protein